MTDHDRNGGGLPPEDRREVRRLRRLAEQMPQNERDSEALLEACHKTRQQVRKTMKAVRLAGHHNITNIYRLLCLAQIDTEIMKEANRRAKRYGIQRTAATSTALFFVKVFSPSSLESATASQQAMALRGAALLSIPPDKLLEKLKIDGGMIALAKHFRESVHPRAPKEKSLIRPSFTWRDNAEKVWRKALQRRQEVTLIVRPNVSGGGHVLEAALVSKQKERADGRQ